ncbi:MAG: hypothetical protein ABIT09_10000 [Croceibacterium sp.]
MRDLNLNELEAVYGAGGGGLACSPTPPSCDSGSKSHKSKATKAKKSKTHKSRKHGSKGYC